MGKNIRKKQGSFFPSLFPVSSFNIRDFRASSTDEEGFSLLFECQGKFPATFRQLKATVFNGLRRHRRHLDGHLM